MHPEDQEFLEDDAIFPEGEEVPQSDWLKRQFCEQPRCNTNGEIRNQKFKPNAVEGNAVGGGVD